MPENRILTQADGERLNPQHWLLAGIALLATFGMAAAIAVVPATKPPAVLQSVVEDLALDKARLVDMDDATFMRETRIQRGDTLGSLLSRLGVDDREASLFLSSQLSARALHRQLATGKTVMAETSQEGLLHRLLFPLGAPELALVVERRDDRLVASEQVLRFETRVLVQSAEIRHSLFGATEAADMPDSVATQLAEIFAGEVDFHRDLRKGDRFSVTYEMNYLRGRPANTGRILAAELLNQGRNLQAVYFEHEGKGGYYTPEGKSLKKAFLRAPLEFSRVSSGFGTRVHPIFLDKRAHKGIDYAAPQGTPVRAVGDGVIEFLGKQGGYGNLIVLRHAGRYSTAYGHLRGFAKGMKKGSRVNQGETIGFVGATGWATGPHLHYEFRVGNQQVNPMSIALPTAAPISPSQMARFQDAARQLFPAMALVSQARMASGGATQFTHEGSW